MRLWLMSGVLTPGDVAFDLLAQWSKNKFPLKHSLMRYDEPLALYYFIVVH